MKGRLPDIRHNIIWIIRYPNNPVSGLSIHRIFQHIRHPNYLVSGYFGNLIIQYSATELSGARIIWKPDYPVFGLSGTVYPKTGPIGI